MGSVVLFPIATFDAGGIELPEGNNWWWLVALLAVPGTGHLLMNWAHPRVKLTVSSMLTLAVPVITTVGGLVFFDESVDAWQVGGIAVVILALTAVIRRESQLVGADA